MVYVTKRVDFSASHRLVNSALSDEDNERIFGPCAHHAGHGHNYALEVTVRGMPNPETGMVINLRELKRLIQQHALAFLDHKNLEVDDEMLKGKVSTAENLAVAIWDRLAPHTAPAELHRIRVYETANNYADYFGSA